VNSTLYLGRVRHRRFAPRPHAFSYPLFMVALDLGELATVFRGRWFWSVERPNLASFRRADHFGPQEQPLDECVRSLVAQATGRRPTGPIRLLTHLRYFGHCFNPVSFYYCYAADGVALECIVAEITNTPWRERHCYVLPLNSGTSQASPRIARWRFDKEFHVSPFMPMNLRYDWRFSPPGEALAVHMLCEREGEKVFDASLALERRPLGAWSMAAVLLRFPVMTLRLLLAIHWQALRLWLKRVPVHTHPANTGEPDSSTSQPLH
jgi:DUF1365 family protein